MLFWAFQLGHAVSTAPVQSADPLSAGGLGARRIRVEVDPDEELLRMLLDDEEDFLLALALILS